MAYPIRRSSRPSDPVDFRKSIDGLAAVCEVVVREQPLHGTLFLFRNRTSDALKALVGSHGGFVMVCKKFERGRFRWPASDVDRATASPWTNATGSHGSPDVSYNANDALTGDDLYTYTYDDEGRRKFRVNRSTLDTSTSTWDALDQLVSLEDEAADTWTFEYGALGRRTRVAKSGTGAFDWVFVYGANNLVSAVFEAGQSTPLMTYRTGESFGEVLAEVRGATERYARRDRLGTTVGWLDDVGDVDEEIARDGYGNRAVAATEVVAFGYTGHAEDPTGLVWGRARYLDATIGAWTAEDPVFTEGRYGYVGSAPLGSVDPTGRSALGGYGGLAKAAVCWTSGVGGSMVAQWYFGNKFLAGEISGLSDKISDLEAKRDGRASQPGYVNKYRPSGWADVSGWRRTVWMPSFAVGTTVMAMCVVDEADEKAMLGLGIVTFFVDLLAIYDYRDGAWAAGYNLHNLSGTPDGFPGKPQ